MNAKQESNYGMYRRLADFLKKNEQVVMSLPDVKPLIVTYNSNLFQISLLIRKQETDISGLRVEKEQLKMQLLELGLDMSKRVIAYTKLHNNDGLFTEVNYTKGDLQKLSDESFVSACWVIHAAAERNMAVLEAYGVNNDSLLELHDAIEAFSKMIHVPKEAQTEKTLGTQKLGELFDSIASDTDKFDALIELLKRNNHDVYVAYLEARKVVQRHGSYMAKGQITDAATGEAIVGAMISFALNNETAFVKISAEGGGFLVKTMDEGIYTVTISKVGYVTQTVSIAVDFTKLAVIEVALVKV